MILLVDIYLITNLINGKRYVGKTVKSYTERFREHCYAGSHTYISEAIHRYGEQNFELQLIDQVPDEEWRYWESYYIDKFQSFWKDGGYNLTRGGDSNPMDEPEIRERHKAIVSSESHRLKISEASKRCWKEHPRGEAYKEKVRENNKRNADAVYAGFRRYNASRQQRVAEIDADGNIIKVFESLSDAARYCNRDPQRNNGTIREACDVINKYGRRARAFGKYWTMKL